MYLMNSVLKIDVKISSNLKILLQIFSYNNLMNMK
jgi:hypothetical protein